jgi:DMSO/TMAO reductase YedYZ molybdopterin-dependent catalytic subunit
MTGERLQAALPEHPADGRESPRSLRIEGLVERPLVLGVADLARLPQTGLTEDFTCEEGWRVPDQAWSGVLVGDLLDSAGVLEAGRWVEFAAGDFRFSAALEEARRALVALDLNGQPVTHQHGGPARLLVLGGACFTSIKWLDRIEVRPDEGLNRAAEISQRRIAAN